MINKAVSKNRKEFVEGRIDITKAMGRCNYRKSENKFNCKNCANAYYTNGASFLGCNMLSQITGNAEIVSRKKICDRYVNYYMSTKNKEVKNEQF